MLGMRSAARVVEDLIVVAAHGPDHIGQCVASLGANPHIVVDTGSGTVPGADVVIPGGHPTGAYLWAYANAPARNYLFIQDSMTAMTPDPVAWFADQMPDLGAVAWGRFGWAYDDSHQRAWVEAKYSGEHPGHGIMGPVFYTNRASLDRLAELDLFPNLPANKIEAQGTERAWAWAYANAGLPVVGPNWDHEAMKTGFGPFRKVWADRR